MAVLFRPGDKIFEEYEVLEFANPGGQCVGYRAKSLRSNRDVYIKQYTGVVDDKTAVSDMKTHYSILKERLEKDRNLIVTPLQIFGKNHSVLAIFPFVEGQTLAEVLSETNGCLERHIAVRITWALARAIDALARSNIAHLDLKPPNVILEKEGIGENSKIFAKLIDLDGCIVDGAGMRGTLVASPKYFSPEHVDGRFGDVGPKSDVFCFGLIWYDLLFGRHPFEGRDYEIAISHGLKEFPEHDYDEGITRLLKASLQPDQNHRPNMSEILAAIEDAGPRLFYKKRTGSGKGGRPDRPGSIQKASKTLAFSFDNDSFSRVYRGNYHIGRNDFRGSGISFLPSRFLSVICKKNNVYLQLSSREVAVEVDGVFLKTGQPVKLNGAGQISINEVTFEYKSGII